MKNVLIYYARTLIIARIAATIIPTPIDSTTLLYLCGVSNPPNLLFYYVCLFMSLVLFHKEKQKVINKSKQ